MTRLLCALTLSIAGVACGSADELFLTGSEAQQLVVNFEAGVETQQLMSGFVFAAARGDLDITGLDYVRPTAGNSWTGALTFPAAVFPFGFGDATVTFRVSGDSGPVDPYLVDLSGDSLVVVDATVQFSGTSRIGGPVVASADFNISATANDPAGAVTVVNGDFDINHDGYDLALAATDLALTVDVVLEEVTNVVGHVDGVVDIPEFEFDGVFSLDGLGTSMAIGINVVATEIRYALDLADLF